jgi:hypothetical protein
LVTPFSTARRSVSLTRIDHPIRVGPPAGARAEQESAYPGQRGSPGISCQHRTHRDFGGYRFPLAYLADALALTHRHRPPAAGRARVFKTPFARLITKIQLPEERNPVVRDNIMYRTYLQSMAIARSWNR